MDTFDLSTRGLERLKNTIRVKYTKETKEKAIKAVNEICDIGLEGNYEGTQKKVFVYPDKVIGSIFNKNRILLFVEYGATYRVTRGQPSMHIFYDRVEAMRKKLKEMGG